MAVTATALFRGRSAAAKNSSFCKPNEGAGEATVQRLATNEEATVCASAEGWTRRSRDTKSLQGSVGMDDIWDAAFDAALLPHVNKSCDS